MSIMFDEKHSSSRNRSMGGLRGKVFPFFPVVESVESVESEQQFRYCQPTAPTAPTNPFDESRPTSFSHQPRQVAHHEPLHNQHKQHNRPSAVFEVIPTADDFAGLMFCSSSDSEDGTDSSETSEATEKETILPKRRLIERIEPSPLPTRPPSCIPIQPIQPIQRPTKKRKRVNFSPSTPQTHHLLDQPPAHALTPEEKSQQWLQMSDLEELKSSAQTVIQHMRILANGVHDRAGFRKMMLILERETGQSIRGLEHRVFRRKENRNVLIRDVLKCQEHLRGLDKFAADFTDGEDLDGCVEGGVASSGFRMEKEKKRKLLAHVSRKRSMRAVSVALSNAKDDYEEVYSMCASATD